MMTMTAAGLAAVLPGSDEDDAAALGALAACLAWAQEKSPPPASAPTTTTNAPKTHSARLGRGARTGCDEETGRPVPPSRAVKSAKDGAVATGVGTTGALTVGAI